VELGLGQPAFCSQQKTQGYSLMIGSLMMCVSVVILLAGMLAGIVMGIQPRLHARRRPMRIFNLVGGVLLFLFGLYYRLVPAAGTTTLAKAQGWLHIVGAILFPAGVAIVLLERGRHLSLRPIVGSLIVTAAMALFVVIVFPDRAGLTVQPIQL